VGHAHERACTFYDESGMRAKLTCVDPKLLAPEFVGREFDVRLRSEFQPDIDPCRENGNFIPLYTQVRCSSTTCWLKWEKSCLAMALHPLT
jgi:hypothetical protein